MTYVSDAATLPIAATLRSASWSVVCQDDTLIRIAARPCHTVPPHQQVPSAWTRAMTRRVVSSGPKLTALRHRARILVPRAREPVRRQRHGQRSADHEPEVPSAGARDRGGGPHPVEGGELLERLIGRRGGPGGETGEIAGGVRGRRIEQRATLSGGSARRGLPRQGRAAGSPSPARPPSSRHPR